MRVFEIIRRIVAEVLDIKEKDISRESSFRGDLGMDIYDRIAIFDAIEGVFDIEIPIADAEKIRTLSEAVKYVESRILGS
jgi:acyl carrier protein